MVSVIAKVWLTPKWYPTDKIWLEIVCNDLAQRCFDELWTQSQVSTIKSAAEENS